MEERQSLLYNTKVEAILTLSQFSSEYTLKTTFPSNGIYYVYSSMCIIKNLSKCVRGLKGQLIVSI